LVSGVGPRSRWHSSQTSGAIWRWRQSWAGVTRHAQKRAFHGRFVPLRQETVRHARVDASAASARTAVKLRA
jgi:hypothetical protein